MANKEQKNQQNSNILRAFLKRDIYQCFLNKRFQARAYYALKFRITQKLFEWIKPPLSELQTKSATRFCESKRFLSEASSQLQTDLSGASKRSCYMKKTIIAFLVALSVILAGCSALFSVGHSNTNTINQTNHKK